MFDYDNSGYKIYVPISSVDKYWSAKYWNGIANHIYCYDYVNDTPYDNITPPAVVNPKVYVDVTAAGWENCHAWAWGLEDTSINYTPDADGIAMWPGIALSTEVVGGKLYYVWTAPYAWLDGETIGFIVNNDMEQTIDLTVTLDAGEPVYVVLTQKTPEGKWLATINGIEAEDPYEPPVEPEVNIEDHTWGVIGSFNSWWDDIAMTVEGNTATATFDIAEDDPDKRFKVRADGAWDINYGFKATEELPVAPVDGISFPASFNIGNIVVTEAGNYTLTFTVEGGVKSFTLKKND